MLGRVGKSQAACGLAFLIGAAGAHGGSFAVNPVRVYLGPGQATASLTVRNDSAEATVVQVGVNTWRQQGDRDLLQPTAELLVIPPVFSIPAGDTQVVRVGLRRAPDSAQELSYRLILEEIPPEPEEGFHGLRVALKISLPVFVLPARKAAPELNWSAVRTEQDAMRVNLSNSGAAHIKVTNFRLSSPGGAELGTRHVADYVLPGQSRGWLVEGIKHDGGTLRLTARTDAGEDQAEVRISSPER